MLNAHQCIKEIDKILVNCIYKRVLMCIEMWGSMGYSSQNGFVEGGFEDYFEGWVVFGEERTVCVSVTGETITKRIIYEMGKPNCSYAGCASESLVGLLTIQVLGSYPQRLRTRSGIGLRQLHFSRQ